MLSISTKITENKPNRCSQSDSVSHRTIAYFHEYLQSY